MGTPKFDGVQAQRKLRTLRRLAHSLAQQQRNLDVQMVSNVLDVHQTTAYAYLRQVCGSPPKQDPWFASGKPIRVFTVAVDGKSARRDALVAALFGPATQREAA